VPGKSLAFCILSCSSISSTACSAADFFSLPVSFVIPTSTVSSSVSAFIGFVIPLALSDLSATLTAPNKYSARSSISLIVSLLPAPIRYPPSFFIPPSCSNDPPNNGPAINVPTTPFLNLASANVSSSSTAKLFIKFFNFPSGMKLASKFIILPSQGSSNAKSFIAPGSQPSCAPLINLPPVLAKKPLAPGA